MTHKLAAGPESAHWGFFDAGLAPALTVESGAVVEIETVSGGPDALPGPGFEIPEALRRIHAETPRPLGSGHILTGPVAVAGAAPGDALQVEILDVRLGTDWGWNAIRPLGGALPDEFPEGRMTAIPLDREAGDALLPWGERLACRPFFGVMGTAPPAAWGVLSSIQPRAFGGNIDCKELTAGSTLYLPVFAPGALFSCGDGHAAQGDGEVCLTAIETALTGRFRLTLRRDLPPLEAPMAETADHWLQFAFDASLDRAARIALRRMIDFIRQRSNLSREDAYMLCSLACDLRITQIVNQQQGVHAMLEKRLIP